MKELVLMVGPPASGKSTYFNNNFRTTHEYINQDSQGKEGHLKLLLEALNQGKNICVDRMGFSKEQRNRYLVPAKDAGYKTKIVVLHESHETCFKRCVERKDHPTIKTERDASSALHFFFKKYERVEDSEADEVVRVWPEGGKPSAIYVDLDNTLCNCEKRSHFVTGEKKDWSQFFKNIPTDTVNKPVMEVLHKFYNTHEIVYCSGRPDNHRKETEQWLKENSAPEGRLFMRTRDDYRKDSITKEVLLDFEVLTRFELLFCLDDRDQVVKMLRNRGLTVFQVAEGAF